MMGNVMWRSPEGQLGRGIDKSSEVFSFGLLCFFVITGVEWLHPDVDNLEVEPEPVILFKLLTAFGPVPDALIRRVNDERGSALLKGLWQSIEEEKLYDPFKRWEEQTFPNLDHEAKRVISSMTNLDPERRLTMAEVMEDPYWSDADDYHVEDVEEST
ncbi:hypothetical protein AAFC00_005057 [Neodothiora populina]|uniref:Protein kinase domain-containing protein n=1 Tax=Neodothiora populina TaxID=2781224 RepID=A0ABR3PJN7_9PEZI